MIKLYSLPFQACPLPLFCDSIKTVTPGYTDKLTLKTRNTEMPYMSIFLEISLWLTILGLSSPSNSLWAMPVLLEMWYLKNTVFDRTTYMIKEISSIAFPTMKYTNALWTEEAPIANAVIWEIAANIPPKACPPTLAVMYFGENLLMMPKRLLDSTALAPWNTVKLIYSWKQISKNIAI